MNATTGNEPHDNTADTDWAALVPEGGERVPELLEQVAVSDSALSDLHDLIHFPAPGHRAAPKVVDRLVDIATADALATNSVPRSASRMARSVSSPP